VGALVGGLYVANRLPALEAWARDLTPRKVFGLLDFAFGGSGLFEGNKLAALLKEQLSDACFEQLDRQFVAVATDLETGREVWLRDGSLVDCMRASYALPGVFSPVKIDGRWLVDGALVNPCPTSVARSFGGELVVAVSLHSDLYGDMTVEQVAEPGFVPPEADTSGMPKWMRPDRMIMDYIFADKPTGPSISRVMIGALNILLDRVTRARLAGDPPDVLIAPHVSHIGLLDFHRAAESIKAGEQAATEMLPSIRRALEKT
jgi:NTE family protein